jgi:hypothetical protein
MSVRRYLVCQDLELDLCEFVLQEAFDALPDDLVIVDRQYP